MGSGFDKLNLSQNAKSLAGGPFSDHLPSSVIEHPNRLLEDLPGVTNEKWAGVGKYAAEHNTGVDATE